MTDGPIFDRPLAAFAAISSELHRPDFGLGAGFLGAGLGALEMTSDIGSPGFYQRHEALVGIFSINGCHGLVSLGF